MIPEAALAPGIDLEIDARHWPASDGRPTHTNSRSYAALTCRCGHVDAVHHHNDRADIGAGPCDLCDCSRFTDRRHRPREVGPTMDALTCNGCGHSARWHGPTADCWHPSIEGTGTCRCVGLQASPEQLTALIHRVDRSERDRGVLSDALAELARHPCPTCRARSSAGIDNPDPYTSAAADALTGGQP